MVVIFRQHCIKHTHTHSSVVEINVWPLKPFWKPENIKYSSQHLEMQKKKKGGERERVTMRLFSFSSFKEFLFLFFTLKPNYKDKGPGKYIVHIFTITVTQM